MESRSFVEIIMLNGLKHITAYFLVLLILTASVNVSINKMTCLMNGKIKYSLEKIEDCAPTTGCNNISKNCCDFDKITLNYSYNSIVKLNTYEYLNSFVTIVNLPQIDIDFSNTFSLVNFYANSSPPLSGFDLLKLIQVFRL